MANYDEFNLDVKNVKLNSVEVEPQSTSNLCWGVSTLVSGTIIGTRNGDCISVNCGTASGCGNNPTYYSC